MLKYVKLRQLQELITIMPERFGVSSCLTFSMHCGPGGGGDGEVDQKRKDETDLICLLLKAPSS